MTITRLHRAVSPFEQLLLRILLSGPRSGLDLVRLCTTGQSDPRVVRATYLALHRLERRGLLASEWRPISGRQLNLKHYRVTAAGCRSVTGTNGSGAPGPQLTVMIVITLIWAADSLGASHDSNRPRFTIVLDDGAAIPPSDIARARGDVTRIFGAVGVDVEWLLLQPTSDSAIGALQRPPRSCSVRAWVTARPPKMTSRSNAIILGIAPHSRLEGGTIVLFYENIQAFAQVLRKSAWSVLAATIAHEIGHILLPSPAHTSTGIMQPSWHEGTSGRIEQSERFFSAQQATLIRQRVTQCTVVPR
jgi:hypothetical protein